MAEQTIVAHFDSRTNAQQATDALIQAGIDQTSIRLLPESETAAQPATSQTSYDHRRDEGGFWNSLGDLALPDEDRYAYAEGMSRGGVTLSVTTDDAHLEQVADILEQHGAVDMDEREAFWRSSGWNGYSTDGTSAATSTPVTTPAAGAGLGAGSAEEGTIELVEEQVNVGKRQTTNGRVRIRAYVVERPVEQQVDLRTEHVTIERRAVDRELAPGEAAFQERTIEAMERHEEAVVAKTARVKEEIAIHKDVETHTETVRDTVRSTEVEVDDERTRQGITSTDPVVPRDPGKI